MGYDMYFRDGTEGDEGYFRLNIWGMPWCVQEMHQRGMVFDAGEYPPWPEYADFGVTQAQVEIIAYPDFPSDTGLTGEEDAAARKYLAARDAVLSWHGPEIPGIPLHKLGSNDGWIVLPAECEAAASIGHKHPPPAQRADLWERWLDYLDRARSHGGFEVH